MRGVPMTSSVALSDFGGRRSHGYGGLRGLELGWGVYGRTFGTAVPMTPSAASDIADVVWSSFSGLRGLLSGFVGCL